MLPASRFPLDMTAKQLLWLHKRPTTSTTGWCMLGHRLQLDLMHLNQMDIHSYGNIRLKDNSLNQQFPPCFCASAVFLNLGAVWNRHKVQMSGCSAEVVALRPVQVLQLLSSAKLLCLHYREDICADAAALSIQASQHPSKLKHQDPSGEITVIPSVINETFKTLCSDFYTSHSPADETHMISFHVLHLFRRARWINLENLLKLQTQLN